MNIEIITADGLKLEVSASRDKYNMYRLSLTASPTNPSYTRPFRITCLHGSRRKEDCSKLKPAEAGESPAVEASAIKMELTHGEWVELRVNDQPITASVSAKEDNWKLSF